MTTRDRFTRRTALRTLGGGLGMLALNGLARAQDLHHAARAKRVIFLCMAGGPSHVDTFDYKPALTRDDGKSTSAARRGGQLLGSPWKFEQRGRSGLWISELFPHLGEHADDLCLLHGMHTDVPAHPQAFVQMHTGSSQFVRPSMGAWTFFGLGTENADLPGFVTLNPPSGQGGAQNYGSAFLPATSQGLRIGVERESRVLRRGVTREGPVEDIANPRLGARAQRRQLDLTRSLNEAYAARKSGDADAIEGVIQSYELAYRMQSALPDLLDLAKEDEGTLERYGIGAEGTDRFGRQCLHALRLAEAGVRFVEVNQGGWDHHRDLRASLPASCAAIDRPIAALLQDLKRERLLDDTLVLWAGEFGRTPYAQNGDGRDHNNRGYTTWMAGGGVKGGLSHGATDEHGGEAVEGRVSIHDWHATILHLLGMDHERLTYPYAGRDFRLTDVHGRVATEVLA